MNTTTVKTDTLASLNSRIFDVIEQECSGLVERSEEGQRLYELRRTLEAAIQEKLGLDTLREFEDLIGSTICHYGEQMFAYGLVIGMHPIAALNLPDSGYDH